MLVCYRHLGRIDRASARSYSSRQRMESFMSVADISLSETVAQYVTGGTNGDESLA